MNIYLKLLTIDQILFTCKKKVVQKVSSDATL